MLFFVLFLFSCKDKPIEIRSGETINGAINGSTSLLCKCIHQVRHVMVVLMTGAMTTANVRTIYENNVLQQHSVP